MKLKLVDFLKARQKSLNKIMASKFVAAARIARTSFGEQHPDQAPEQEIPLLVHSQNPDVLVGIVAEEGG